MLNLHNQLIEIDSLCIIQDLELDQRLLPVLAHASSWRPTVSLR
jgi:hypothetical protein